MFFAYIQYRYVILVSRLGTQFKLLLNTLVSYYRKLFGSLNPPRFSVDGNYLGTNRNLKLPNKRRTFVEKAFIIKYHVHRSNEVLVGTVHT